MSSVRTKPAEPMAPASLTIVGAVAPPRSEARLVGATQEAWRARFQTWDGLMAAAQAGDSVAYARLLHELDRWLRRYYGRRLSAAAAEDAKQEAMLAIHTARQTFVSSRSFSAWALAIARYKLMDCFRVACRCGTQALSLDIPVTDHGEAVIRNIEVENLLGRLGPAQASVIRLVKLEGASVAEASSATGQSVALVKVNIHRGLKRLATIVADAGKESPSRRA